MSEPTEAELRRRIAELEAQLSRRQGELKESLPAGRCRDVFEGIGLAIIVCANDGTVVEANRRACELLQRASGEITGGPAGELVVDRERERFGAAFAGALEGGGTHAGFTLRREQGGDLPVEVRLQRIDAVEGPLVALLAEDVSELGRRDRERYKQTETQAIGTLCEGVAHQFNNLLARMLACAEDASEAPLAGRPAEDLRTIVRSCEEATHITESLLCYAGRQPLRLQTVNPTNILDDAVQMLEPELLAAGINVTRDYTPVPDMTLDNVQMGRMFEYLIRNARDAMPHGGRLHLTCGVQDGEVVITISDTGGGIPKELLDRIFLPFVTTKGALSRSEVPGMGLGLCACQGIARSHHGDISVHSTPGKGTTFTIRLPLGDSGGSGPVTK